MIGLLCFVLAVLASPFKSKMRLEAENAVLRHQLIVLRRKLRGRVQLANSDRWFFVQLYHWFPSILQVLTIIRPETLIRWHRSGFRCYWRWKSQSLGGRPQIEAGLRAKCCGKLRRAWGRCFFRPSTSRRPNPPAARLSSGKCCDTIPNLNACRPTAWFLAGTSR